MEKKGDPNFHKPSEKNNHFHVQYRQKQKCWESEGSFLHSTSPCTLFYITSLTTTITLCRVKLTFPLFSETIICKVTENTCIKQMSIECICTNRVDLIPASSKIRTKILL